ncbi:unnamed protein product, partial [Rotaria sp. Silwood1]
PPTTNLRSPRCFPYFVVRLTNNNGVIDEEITFYCQTSGPCQVFWLHRTTKYGKLFLTVRFANETLKPVDAIYSPLSFTLTFKIVNR